MPLYEYECRNCGHRAEVLHGVNDAGPTACEVCGGPLRKLLSPPAIVFKGSGWAKKDYRDTKSKQKSTAGAGKSEAGDSGPASTSDGAADKPAKTDATETPKPTKGAASAS